MHYKLATTQCVSFCVSQLLWQHLSVDYYALPTDAVTKYSPHGGEEVLSLQAALLLSLVLWSVQQTIQGRNRC